MATELKGEWSLTEVTKSGVTSKTASYKINGKEVIKLTNLSPDLTVDKTDKTIDGLTVDEDNKTVTLSGDALNKQTVAFTSSTYKLELDNVPAVKFTDVQSTVASGKVTFKSPLSEGYTLSANGKTLAYSAAKTESQELATVSGLATTFTADDVSIGDGVITLNAAALKQGTASLALKNGAAYTLAIGNDVDTIKTTGTWTYASGKATLKGTVDTAGYAVSADGKKVNYIAATKTGTTATLATVSGLGKDFGSEAVATDVDENGNYVITLPASSLNKVAVSVSGNGGYALALDSGVTTSENAEKRDEWTVNKATATYNQVMPEHYDIVGGKVVYTKEATVQTYAKVTGLKSSGLEASVDKKSIKSGTTDVVTVSGKVITLKQDALTTSNVTLTSDDYSLALDGVQGAVIDTSTGSWALSGKTGGVYKATITTAGWGQKDSKTITYAKTGSATVGTITGLASGITKDDLGKITVTVNGDEGTFTIPEKLLTNGDVTLTNGNGFGYTLETDAPFTGEAAYSWEIDETTPTTAKLFYGKSAYYTSADGGITLAYNEPVQGNRVATVQNLKEGTTADLLPKITEEDFDKSTKKYTIKLSKDVLDQKTVVLTGTGYALGLVNAADLKPQSGNTVWEVITDDKTTKATKATLSSYTTEGWVPNSTGTQIVYTAPVKGATLATIEGYKNGLKTNEDGIELAGITVYNEATPNVPVTASKTGETRNYDAKTIAIQKAAVGSGDIKLTSTEGYKLGVGNDLVNSEATDNWDVDATKGTAIYTYMTPAGYAVKDDGKTFNSEKSSKFTATLTGLDTSKESDIKALAVDNGETKSITLTSSVLKGEKVTIKGNYVLAIDSTVKEPELGDPTWDISAKGTAKLNGSYTEAGYTLDTKGTTLTYTKADDQTKTTLATVSGLTNPKNDTDDAKAVDNDGTAGLEVDNGVITVSQKYLGTSKVTVKNAAGSNYSLAIGDDVEPQEKPDPVKGWVVKGTNATYQEYTPGYYSIEEKTGAIAWNKDSNATVYATVSGLLKDSATSEELDAAYDESTKTLTLTADQLGTAKVTLTNKKVGDVTSTLKLALDSEVPQNDYTDTTEWVRSGTKATYQTYKKGYYTLSGGNTVTFANDKDVKVHLTLTGVLGDVTEANMNTTDRIITLNATQLNGGKNKVTTKLTTSKEENYTGYTIALAKGVSQPKESAKTWTADGKGKANYIQPVDTGNYVLDAAGTTVTYYTDPTNLTLATISGLNKNIDETAVKNIKVTEDTENGTKVITLTSEVLKTDDANKSTKVSVSTKGYTLAIDSSLAPETTNSKWVFANLTKSGTAVYQNDIGAGYVVDAKQTSVSYSAAKKDNAAITLSGLNKNYSGNVETLTAAAAGITVDDTAKTVTLSNADLLTTSKITLKNGTGANYTLDVATALNPTELDADTAVWTLKGTNASLNLGMSAGYKKDNDTTVSYVKENPNKEIATLSGLGKSVKAEGGKLGTINNKVFTQGVFIHATGTDNAYNIVFAPEVLGTTNVELKNTDGSGYTYSLSAESLTAPDTSLAPTWDYVQSKGTATLYKTTVAGWTLEGTTKLVYTPGKENAVLTTFSGLSKTFEGDIDKAINTPTGTADVITVKDASLLGTGTASLKNATGYTYSLALGSNIPNKTQSETPVTQWLTSGAKASLKTYNPAYYSINDKGAIVYNKAADVKGKLYAEVSGIKKDVDISDCVSGNVITLGADQLDAKNVTLTNKTVDSVTSEYKLALGSDSLKATLDPTATWATKNGTATLTGKVSPGYTASSDGLKLTYAKNATTPAIATIKGVKVTLDGSYDTSNTTFTLGADSLTSVVTIDGKEIFDFKFSKGYDSAKITGAATADTINAAGDKLNINTGNGNDVVTVSGANVSITAGAGDDTISISGGNASINAGAGNDSIKSGGGNNVFYYATGNGNDTITGFAATDKIMTNAQAKVIDAKSSNGNAVITIGAGTKTASTITLTGKAVSSISIVDTKGNAITPSYAASSDVLLADDNYSTDAAALTDITDAFHASYTPYDFESGLDLVKKDSFTPVVSYTGDDK